MPTMLLLPIKFLCTAGGMRCSKEVCKLCPPASSSVSCYLVVGVLCAGNSLCSQRNTARPGDVIQPDKVSEAV